MGPLGAAAGASWLWTNRKIIALLVLGGLVASVVVVVAGLGAFDEVTSAESAQARLAQQNCGSAAQPAASSDARNSIPANYLAIFKQAGARYGVPWVILAGIGKVESDDGRSTLPGVHSGSNAFGAAGPMQIGIGGASSNTWGGAPVHPASEQVSGVATDGDGDGIASVYDPADAIAGAARYLVEHGVQGNPQAAVFAYNHAESYVQLVLSYAGRYAAGGFSVSPVTLVSAAGCLTADATPNGVVAKVIAYARQQLGKPYQWGGTGPDSFDCSGLVMEAYRAAGILIPRTSESQWTWGPRVAPGQVEPGDLVFFAGSDGTVQSPGHVGLVIGGGEMIEAYATGFPIRVASYTGRDPVGFTRPWLHRGTSAPETTR